MSTFRSRLAAFTFGALAAAMPACTSAPADLPEEDNLGTTAQALVTAPIGQWAWNDVPGSRCGYGQQTGFAVNLGSGTDVLIYLEGGGLCWDQTTCTAGVNGIGPASYFTAGYNGATFAANQPVGGIFDRTRPNNPFKNSTIVYVPYCTGDFHSGNNTAYFPVPNKTAYWAGRQNLELYLSMIVPAFSNASKVTLAGSSAGGFGALINYGRVNDVFGGKRVDLISDSAPALWNQAVIMSGYNTNIWKVWQSLPADCANCASNMQNLYGYYQTKYPNARKALVSFDQDTLMAAGGYTVTPYPDFYNHLRGLTANVLQPLPSWKYFVATGDGHTMLYRTTQPSQPRCCSWIFGACFPYDCGTSMTLESWLKKMATDDPTWTKQTSIHGG